MAKRNVQCVKPSDPPFLRKMKEQCGFTQTTIETKKQTLQLDPDADKDGDDELPQVVVLTRGDLTQDEADKILKQSAEEVENDGASKTGSCMKFSTKTKRSGDRNANEGTDQKKKKLKDDLKKKTNVKAVKNSSLLSFDEDGDEEGY